MSDLTSTVSALLEAKNVPPIRHVPYSVEDINEFLKEAYQIVQTTVLPT